MSYSKYKVENNEKWTTTAVVCGKLNGNKLDDVNAIMEVVIDCSKCRA